jgi:fatty acid desaturase
MHDDRELAAGERAVAESRRERGEDGHVLLRPRDPLTTFIGHLVETLRSRSRAADFGRYHRHVSGIEPAGAVGDPYRSYRRTLLTKQELSALTRLRPNRVIVDVALLWTEIAAAMAAVAIWPRWWVVLLAIPVIGTRYYALFIIGHDGMHRRLFLSAPTNDLFCDTLILGPVGAISRINKRNHLAHHRHLASELDPDRHKHACFNKSSRGEYLMFLTGFASVMPELRNVFSGNHTSAKRGLEYRWRDVAILIGWQVLLIGVLTLAIGWWAYPLLWLLPVYVHTYLADLLRSFLEHSQLESDSAADDHRLVTYSSNRVERAFFAPKNMNFHATHHLWPAIPYYNLPDADRIIRERDGSEGLEWRGSYVRYLFDYYVALPIAGCVARRAA